MTTTTDTRAALEEFYRRRAPYVATMARDLARRTGENVDDLIGAAWLCVVTYADRLAAADWSMGLFVVMARGAMWRVCQKSRRARGMASIEAAEIDPAGRAADPLDEIIHAERLDRLGPAIAELSRTDQKALVGRYGLGGREPMSTAELVDVLHKRCRRTAQYAVSAARRRLAEKMGE